MRSFFLPFFVAILTYWHSRIEYAWVDISPKLPFLSLFSVDPVKIWFIDEWVEINSHAVLTSTLLEESLQTYSKGAPVTAFKPIPVNPDSIFSYEPKTLA